jgi:site-specific DNA recombinase
MAVPDFFKEVFDQFATDGYLGDPHGKPSCAYLRVSSAGQMEDGRSGLPRQLAHVHEIASQKGYRVPWELVFADDHTGFEFKDRPDLTRLRTEYKSPNRRANAIIMENLDRLSRNADWHQGFLLDEMKEHGVEPVFWKSFSSRIERAVIGAISQEGMEQAKQRMAEGNIFKAKDGRVTARVPAYGYVLVDSDGTPGEKAKTDSHYAIYPQEAEVVRTIYAKIGLEGWSLGRLATYLQERYPPPKKSAYWSSALIRIMLLNSVYKGEFISHHTQQVKIQKRGLHSEDPTRIVVTKIERPEEEWIIVPVPAIVSPEEWETAHRILQKNAQMSKRNAKEPYLLTGLMKCATCGFAYVGSSAPRTKNGRAWRSKSYRCGSRSSNSPAVRKAAACVQSQIVCQVLDDAVWSTICKVLLDSQMLVESLERDYASGHNGSILEQIGFLEREINQRDEDDARLYKAYLAGAFDENEYAGKRRELRESRHRLEEDLHTLRGQVMTREDFHGRKRLVLAVADQALKSGLVMDAPFDIKQRVIKLVVDKIVLNVNEGWFRMDGMVRGKYELSGPIAYTPAGRGSGTSSRPARPPSSPRTRMREDYTTIRGI